MPRTPYPVVRQPVASFGRGNAPQFSASVHAVLRKKRGADPEQILRSFTGSNMAARQHAATQELGELLVRKAKEYAPRSESPETSGNMAAGIRLVRVNANTVEIVAPPPALWRIEGFEATGGLRPWLAKSSAGQHAILMSIKNAELIHHRLLAAMHKDYKEAMHGHEAAMDQHLREREGIEGELGTIKATQEHLDQARQAAAHRMTREEAAARKEEINARARSHERDADELIDRAEGMQRRSTPHPKTGKVQVEMTPTRERSIARTREAAQKLMERAATLRSRLPDIKAGMLVRDPAFERQHRVRVGELAQQRGQVEARLRASHQAEPLPPQSANIRDRSGRPVTNGLRGRHYQAAAAALRTEIGETRGRLVQTGEQMSLRGSKVRVLEYGENGVRTTTLQKLMEGAFRYPVGYNFLEKAVEDSESQAAFEKVAAEAAKLLADVGEY